MSRIRTAGFVAAFLVGFVASAFGQTINRSGGGGGSAIPGGDCTGTVPALVCTKSNGVTFGTAAFQPTGTSGATIPFLNTGNVWSGLQNYAAGETNSLSPGSGVSAKTFLGAILTGAGGTNNLPHIFIQPSGTTPIATNWSNNGTIIGVNTTAFAGPFIDYKVGGNTVFSVLGSNGAVSVGGAGSISTASGNIAAGGSLIGTANASKILLRNGGTFVTSPASAQWQFGDADAAAPVAQLVRTQGSRSTIDASTAGANLTIQPGIGTGNVLTAALIFNGVIGNNGGTTNAQTVAAGATVPGVASGQLPGLVIGSAAIAANATDGFLYLASGAGTPTGTPTTFTGRVPMYVDTTNAQLWLFLGGTWKQPKTPAGAALVTWQ